jgi:ABC-type multidrug transport system ATPase subunit
MTTGEPAITVADLTKDYGDVRAVDGLSFTVDRGEVFGLLGPNGAGKTTTVEVLEGHRRASGGTVAVLGCDPRTGGRGFRERVGIVLQEAGLDESFTVRELVAMYAGFYPRPRDVDEVIELVGLADKRRARVPTLSGGQRRRLDLALGIVGDPELLFLDEPTTGFDPAARRRAWELVAALRDQGTTIVLTTHYMEEAEHLADRVGIVASGRMVALGTPAEIVADLGTAATLSFRLPDGVPVTDLPTLGEGPRPDGALVQVRTDAPTEDLAALTSWALRRGSELEQLHLSRPTLEDVYLDLVAGAGRPGTPVEAASRA